MKKIRTYKDWIYTIKVYRCERCDKEINEAHPFILTEDGAYCPSCAFIEGIIDSERYLKEDYYWCPTKQKAIVKDGIIYVADEDKKFEFEKTNGDYRKTKEYSDWRKQVFERDEWKCQSCGQVGGKLNAHHIKTFRDHPKLRYDVDNGITLCEKCHKDLHKELRNG